MESLRHVFCYLLVVVVGVVLVQSLPTARHADGAASGSPLERKVYWSNVSQDYPATIQTEAERQAEEETVRTTIREMRKSGERCRPFMTPGLTLFKDMSLCPWSYHTEDVDENRIPVLIPQAYCECPKCHFSRLANYPGRMGGMPSLRLSSSCKEVFENRQVLRRANETSPYVPYQVSVSVACVCHKH